MIRRGLAKIAFIALVGFADYVATVGAAFAISRQIEDGRLQWMRSSSLASAAIETYVWPARRLGGLPPLRWLFELSANFWCGITDAPETTG